MAFRARTIGGAGVKRPDRKKWLTCMYTVTPLCRAGQMQVSADQM